MILCDKLCDVLNSQGLIQSFVRYKSRQDMEEMSWRDLSGANIFDMGKYREYFHATKSSFFPRDSSFLN